MKQDHQVDQKEDHQQATDFISRLSGAVAEAIVVILALWLVGTLFLLQLWWLCFLYRLLFS